MLTLLFDSQNRRFVERIFCRNIGGVAVVVAVAAVVAAASADIDILSFLRR